MNELALFAGAGGGILGGHILGWRTVCAVEWEPYAACVLAARQNDGILPPFPIWDDVQTFDGRPWRGIVDVVSGGFPCQDISAAGKGAGIEGEQSGMWREMARVVCEVRPRYVFVENSPMLTSRGLGKVLGDLASLGFDAKWGVLGAADVGAPHQRDRIWIVAKWRGQLSHAQLQRIGRWEQQQESIEETDGTNVVDFVRDRSQRKRSDWSASGHARLRGGTGSDQKQNVQLANTKNKGDVWRVWSLGETEGKHDHRRSASDGRGEWWSTEPNVGRVANGVAAKVDRLKAIGNGQVPTVAAAAFKILTEKNDV